MLLRYTWISNSRVADPDPSMDPAGYNVYFISLGNKSGSGLGSEATGVSNSRAADPGLT